MAHVRRVGLLYFFSLFFFLMQVAFISADDPIAPVYHSCLHNTSSSAGLSSAFKSNLNLALRNLTRLAASTRFAMTSIGSAPDAVYAIFQCRGDQALSNCSACMDYVTTTLPQTQCPNYIGARVQVNGCFLRYDNRSFSSPDFSYAAGFCFADTQDSTILESIQSLVQNVTQTAPKNRGFAMASSAATGEYALAQCLGYLNESECAECVAQYFSAYATLCPSTSLGEQLHLTSCYVRHEPYNFFGSAPSSSAAAPPPSPKLLASPTSHTGRKKMRVIIIASTLAFGAILATIIVCLMLRWRHKSKHLQESIDMEGRNQRQLLFQAKLSVFPLHDLEVATQHFHCDNKLGEGAFGPVYKGTLPNGECVAIKMLSSKSQQGEGEFLNEVKLLAAVQHKNLVKLYGSCVEGDQRILVYEYLPRKSLNDVLFENSISVPLIDWPTRYGIILGMARGLTYLHEDSQVRIVHRDIKPSNILLDNQFNPIISDFGLARLVADDVSKIITRIAGTVGYMAPEYSVYGELTEKVDVFSFGVVTLEVLSGKKNENSKLLAWAWRLYLERSPLDLVDANLHDNVLPMEEILRVVLIALLCTQENPKKRPPMSMVLSWLLGESNIVEVPIKPRFIDLNAQENEHNIVEVPIKPSSIDLNAQENEHSIVEVPIKPSSIDQNEHSIVEVPIKPSSIDQNAQEIEHTTCSNISTPFNMLNPNQESLTTNP